MVVLSVLGSMCGSEVVADPTIPFLDQVCGSAVRQIGGHTRDDVREEIGSVANFLGVRVRPGRLG